MNLNGVRPVGVVSLAGLDAETRVAGRGSRVAGRGSRVATMIKLAGMFTSGSAVTDRSIELGLRGYGADHDTEAIAHVRELLDERD